MGVLVMVLGPSGSGKSSSIVNLAGDEAEIFCATRKRMPFRTPVNAHLRAGYREIYESLKANEKRCYVIDDSTYLMQFDNFARVKETGYDKFTAMARSFEFLLEVAADTSDETIVYFLHHPQFADTGSCKPQTIGKMLDSQLCIEGLFDLVIECAVEDGKHLFFTNDRGIAKSPAMMLPETMPNDLAAVDKAIREYWGMGELYAKPQRKRKAGEKVA